MIFELIMLCHVSVCQDDAGLSKLLFDDRPTCETVARANTALPYYEWRCSEAQRPYVIQTPRGTERCVRDLNVANPGC